LFLPDFYLIAVRNFLHGSKIKFESGLRMRLVMKFDRSMFLALGVIKTVSITLATLLLSQLQVKTVFHTNEIEVVTIAKSIATSN